MFCYNPPRTMQPEESLMQLRTRAWHDDVELRHNDTAEDGDTAEDEGDENADDDDDFDNDTRADDDDELEDDDDDLDDLDDDDDDLDEDDDDEEEASEGDDDEERVAHHATRRRRRWMLGCSCCAGFTFSPASPGSGCCTTSTSCRCPSSRGPRRRSGPAC